MARINHSHYQLPALSGWGPSILQNFWLQATLVVVLGFGIYYNSLGNKYALDDDIVIRQNRYVMQGFSGIDSILSSDAYESFYKSMGVEQQLSGGRYRPLSIVTFAIENGLFFNQYQPETPKPGLTAEEYKNFNEYQEKVLRVQHERIENDNIAGIRHGFQVFYFVLSMVVLLYFLRNCVFRTNTHIALIATLLFTAHPIHTEVIANVKSRDEIFSLLFILLTLIFYFRYDQMRKLRDIILCCVFFFLALLSKEYAVITPILAIVGTTVVLKRKLFVNAINFVPLLGVLLLYFAVRAASLPGPATVNLDTQDILNDPYLNLKKVRGVIKEKGSIAATKIDILDNYPKLLVYPNKLSADYSYRHFPYSSFKTGGVWISLLLHLALIILAFWLWMRRHIMAFAFAIYFGFFFLICNIFFDIGATMGERLIYHSSLGFVMLVAWGLAEGGEWLNRKKLPGSAIAAFVVVVIVSLYGWKTVERNPDWHDDFTLFTKDVKYVTESALANGNAGARYMDKGIAVRSDSTKTPEAKQQLVRAFADTALKYLYKAVEIHPRYVNGYLNIGLCHYYRDEYPQAAEAWGNANTYFNHHPLLHEYAKFFRNKGIVAGNNKNYDSASVYFGWATKVDDRELEYWSNYAGSSYMAGKFKEARDAFNAAYQFNTKNEDIAHGYREAEGLAKMQDTLRKDSANPGLWLQYARAMVNQPAFDRFISEALQKAQRYAPGDTAVRNTVIKFEERKRKDAEAAAKQQADLLKK